MAASAGYRSWPVWAIILFGIGGSAAVSLLFNVSQSAGTALALRVFAGVAGFVVCVLGLIVVFRWANATDRRNGR
ncbi:hypothetical protein ABFT23_04780 [Nocardioides sp. C4-1]|uniref:hypothetical protein n=1 Tax=Nocardioides sp. C4-1 TaxID=3151851 RepID=UPI00326431F3